MIPRSSLAAHSFGGKNSYCLLPCLDLIQDKLREGPGPYRNRRFLNTLGATWRERFGLVGPLHFTGTQTQIGLNWSSQNTLSFYPQTGVSFFPCDLRIKKQRFPFFYIWVRSWSTQTIIIAPPQRAYCQSPCHWGWPLHSPSPAPQETLSTGQEHLDVRHWFVVPGAEWTEQEPWPQSHPRQALQAFERPGRKEESGRQ